MPDDSDFICEVCKHEPAKGVACVPGIPLSVAYGKNCLERGADPYWAIRANVACCGGVYAVRPEYLETMTFFQDRYMTLREALVIEPITEEELR